ncbi:MAG: hypothetical protein A2Z29_02500 [Chloroflexi bacterium RBG_16_56_11]|nr:MAG: hypothetical protein A2Z29_02500 [Chloroflexi bacterium RBG_16_56_11]
MEDNNSHGNSENDREEGISRRRFISRLWWAAAGVVGIEIIGGLVASLQPRVSAGSFGGKIKVATVAEARAMPVGTVTYFPEQRFYLSRVESGFLALYRKCTHVGCVVPWQPDDPSEDGLAPKGRFNCPCHGGIFDRYGIVHSGPPPRPLDIFPISIEDAELVVDTGNTIERTGFEQSQVTEV